MGLCSRCGKRGHNKRTCPTRKKRKAPGGGAGAGDGGRPAGGGADGDRSQPHVPPPPQKRAKLATGAPPPRMTRGALERAIAEADEPDDLPLFPVAVKAAGGGRFPWHIALQFAAARDLAVLARTHRAARKVCGHKKMYERIVKARHGRGCKRAKDQKCTCSGCARVALLQRSAEDACDGDPARWLRRLHHTELGAAARFLALRSTRARHADLRRRAAAAGLAEGADGRATGAIVRFAGAMGAEKHGLNGVYDFWEVNEDGSPAFLKRGGDATWLYLAMDRSWCISDKADKDARGNVPRYAYNYVEVDATGADVAPPLPHRAAAGAWKVWDKRWARHASAERTFVD